MWNLFYILYYLSKPVVLSYDEKYLIDKYSSIIINNYQINQYGNKKYALERFCIEGKYNVFKYMLVTLYIDDDLNVHNDNEYIFRMACHFGHKNIAQLLYYTTNPDVYINDNYAFKISCYNNHLDIAEWLSSLDSKYKIIYLDNKFIPYIRNQQEIYVMN